MGWLILLSINGDWREGEGGDLTKEWEKRKGRLRNGICEKRAWQEKGWGEGRVGSLGIFKPWGIKCIMLVKSSQCKSRLKWYLCISQNKMHLDGKKLVQIIDKRESIHMFIFWRFSQQPVYVSNKGIKVRQRGHTCNGTETDIWIVGLSVMDTELRVSH